MSDKKATTHGRMFPPRVETGIQFTKFITLDKDNLKVYAPAIACLLLAVVAGLMNMSIAFMVLGAVGLLLLLFSVVLEAVSNEYNSGLEIIHNNIDYYRRYFR